MYIIIVQFAQWRCWPVLAHRVSLAWRERVNPIRRVSLEGVSEFVASHVHLIRQQQPPRPMLGRTSARASPRERLALHVLRSGASAKQGEDCGAGEGVMKIDTTYRNPGTPAFRS